MGMGIRLGPGLGLGLGIWTALAHLFFRVSFSLFSWRSPALIVIGMASWVLFFSVWYSCIYLKNLSSSCDCVPVRQDLSPCLAEWLWPRIVLQGPIDSINIVFLLTCLRKEPLCLVAKILNMANGIANCLQFLNWAAHPSVIRDVFSSTWTKPGTKPNCQCTGRQPRLGPPLSPSATGPPTVTWPWPLCDTLWSSTFPDN